MRRVTKVATAFAMGAMVLVSSVGDKTVAQDTQLEDEQAEAAIREGKPELVELFECSSRLKEEAARLLAEKQAVELVGIREQAAELQKKWTIAPATNGGKAYVSTGGRPTKSVVKAKAGNDKSTKRETLANVRNESGKRWVAKRKEQRERAELFANLKERSDLESDKVARRERRLGKIPGLAELGIEQAKSIPIAATTPEAVEFFETLKIRSTKKPRNQRKLEESRRRFLMENPKFHEGPACEFCALQLSHDKLGQQVLAVILEAEGYEVTYRNGVVLIETPREINWVMIRIGLIEQAAIAA